MQAPTEIGVKARRTAQERADESPPNGSCESTADELGVPPSVASSNAGGVLQVDAPELSRFAIWRSSMAIKRAERAAKLAAAKWELRLAGSLADVFPQARVTEVSGRLTARGSADPPAKAMRAVHDGIDDKRRALKPALKPPRDRESAARVGGAHSAEVLMKAPSTKAEVGAQEAGAREDKATSRRPRGTQGTPSPRASPSSFSMVPQVRFASTFPSSPRVSQGLVSQSQASSRSTKPALGMYEHRAPGTVEETANRRKQGLDIPAAAARNPGHLERSRTHPARMGTHAVVARQTRLEPRAAGASKGTIHPCPGLARDIRVALARQSEAKTVQTRSGPSPRSSTRKPRREREPERLHDGHSPVSDACHLMSRDNVKGALVVLRPKPSC